tara:strand:+ start:2551 stop:3006 length:456 start_codon:yes stop_codon:yes gene_type:complete
MKFIIIIIILFIVNCSGNKVSNFHGSKQLETKYNIIKVNVTNKNDLLGLIGQPSSVSDFNNNKWFYIERLKTNQSLIKLGNQKIEKNNVLVVELDNFGIVRDKKLLDIKNMNDFSYLNTTTEKDFKNENILYDIFSSLREKINAPSKNRSK